MNHYKLSCLDSRKSFYGKAVVIVSDTGTKYLKSYYTIVCSVSADGEFTRYWPGGSATTMRHINSFLTHCGLAGGGVAWWREQPIQELKEEVY